MESTEGCAARTRYVTIKKLHAKTALAVHYATIKSFKSLHHKVRQSITYDNGLENMLHEQTNEVLGADHIFVIHIIVGKKELLKIQLVLLEDFILKGPIGKILLNGI
jgi:hypothetical protein